MGHRTGPGMHYAPGLEEARVQTLETGGMGRSPTAGCVNLSTWLNLSVRPLHLGPGISREPTFWGVMGTQ